MSLVQDTLIEGDEVFSVVLSTTNSNVQINDGVTTVTILDDDSKYEHIFITFFIHVINLAVHYALFLSLPGW